MPTVKIRRLIDAPIISAVTDASLGENIQGPSLVRVPEWVDSPQGLYSLYFADHKGQYIRLAYADALSGPWTVHVPGSLQLEDSHFPIEPPGVPPGALERIREAARFRCRLRLRRIKGFIAADGDSSRYTPLARVATQAVVSSLAPFGYYRLPKNLQLTRRLRDRLCRGKDIRWHGGLGFFSEFWRAGSGFS